MRNSAQQTTYEERLRVRVMSCGGDAVEAAIALMERYEPESLEDARALLLGGGEFPPRCVEILTEAWGRYFHIRDMSWE